MFVDRFGRRALTRLGYRPSPPRFRPCLEALEDRTLLDGNPYPNIVPPAVVYDAQTQELTILGSYLPDAMTVEADANDIIVVTHNGQRLEPVDPLGVPLPVELHPTVKNTADLTAFLFDGNDFMRIFPLSGVPTTVFGQAGNDELTASLFGGELTATLLGGIMRFDASGDVIGDFDRDRLRLDTGNRDEFVTIEGVPGLENSDPEIRVIDKATNVLRTVVSFLGVEETTVDTRGGGDQVLMDNTTGLLSGIDWNISTGAGDDVFQYLRAKGGSASGPIEVNVDSGAGDDRLGIAIDALFEELSLQADAGSGDDAVLLSVFVPKPPEQADPCTPVTLDLNLRLGDGNDVLNGFFESAILPMALRLQVAGEDGDDDISHAYKHVPLDELVCTEPISHAVALDGGLGDDVIEAAVKTAGDVMGRMIGGTGDDVLAIRSAVTGGSQHWQIDAGEGDNETQLLFGDGTQGQMPPQGTRIEADYRSGNENDRLTAHYAGPLEVEFNLLADTGGGDDVVDVTIDPHGLREHPDPPPPVTLAIHSAFARTGDGADTVALDVAFPDAFSSIVADFGIDTGAGDDSLGIRLASAADFLDLGVAADTGGGADTATFEIAAPSDQSTIVAEYAIDTRAGDDRLAFLYNSAAAASSLNLQASTGDDDDTIDVQIQAGGPAPGPNNPGAVFLAAVAIDLGDGHDLLAFKLASAAPLDVTARLIGGAGSDRIAARCDLSGQGVGSLAVAVEGGDGDDELELAVLGADALDKLFALLDGGDGFDIGRATLDVLVKEIEQFTPIDQ